MDRWTHPAVTAVGGAVLATALSAAAWYPHQPSAYVADARALVTSSRALRQTTTGVFRPPAYGEPVSAVMLTFEQVGARVEQKAALLAATVRDYDTTQGDALRKSLATRIHQACASLRDDLRELDNAAETVIMARTKILADLDRIEQDVP